MNGRPAQTMKMAQSLSVASCALMAMNRLNHPTAQTEERSNHSRLTMSASYHKTEAENKMT